MSKLKLAFIISASLNALLLLYIGAGLVLNWYARKSGNFDGALYQAVHKKLCEEDYHKILKHYDEVYAGDAKRAGDAKNSFAINVCLRNYKTGQPLDLQPLLDQVK